MSDERPRIEIVQPPPDHYVVVGHEGARAFDRQASGWEALRLMMGPCVHHRWAEVRLGQHECMDCGAIEAS